LKLARKLLFINAISKFWSLRMMTNQENQISYEKWTELTAREIFYEDEKPKSLSKLYDMFGDDFETEESPGSKVKKRRL